MNSFEVAVCVSPELLDGGGVHGLGDIVDAAVLHRYPVTSDPLAAKPLAFPLGLLQLGAEGRDALRHLLGARVQRPRHLGEKVPVPPDEVVGRLARDQVDPA